MNDPNYADINFADIVSKGDSLNEENGNGNADDFFEPDLYTPPPAPDTQKKAKPGTDKKPDEKKPDDKKDNTVTPKAPMRPANNDKKNPSKQTPDNDY
ncbi:MAG: hypothetical protein EOO03_08215 [Chitinophagaceae bacterium]|nr:MAG: hypothetical protein EOO03_08215 [Chitinophagaceae bacterium]